jgi:hypothetical protein
VFTIRFHCSTRFKKSSFGSYWFATGTPTYLVQLLKTASYDLNELYGDIYASEVDLNSFDGNNNLVGAFYQSGYLTIKDFDGEVLPSRTFPTSEVEEGFTQFHGSLTMLAHQSVMQGSGGSSKWRWMRATPMPS